MKIGIDGTVLTQKYESGQKRCLENLLNNLSVIDSVNHYYIFARPGAIIPDKKNFKLVTLPTWLPILKRQVLIPILSRLKGVEVFYFPDIWGSVIPPAKKTIATFHDLAPKTSYPAWYKSLKYFLMRVINYFTRRFTLKYATRIILVSKAIHMEYNKVYGSDRRIVIIPQGIPHWFKWLKTKKGNYFMAFTDFSPRKNIDGVLGAYKIFLERFKSSKKPPRLKIIISNQYPKDRIMKTAKSLGVYKYIDILIGISNAELVKTYNKAQALIFPSFYEGFGFPVLEAFVCGCPVITTNYGSTKELAGGAALLVDPTKQDKITEAMEKIMYSKKISSGLIKKGFKRSRDFNWRKTAQMTLKVFTSI